MLHNEVSDDVSDGNLAGGGTQIVRNWPVGGDDRPGCCCCCCCWDERSASIIDIKTEQTPSSSISTSITHAADNAAAINK